MAWKMTGDPKTRKLTRGLAQEFSGMTPAPHDRPFGHTRSAVIRKAVELGQFRTCSWATAYCEQTKEEYRVNGKHTSTVFADMNGTFPKNLFITVEKYHCDTMEDVARLYATFDTRASVRLTGDINRIFAATVPELNEVPGRIINSVVTGIAYSLWEDTYSTHHTAEDRAQLIIPHAAFAVWFGELMTGVDSRKISHLRRGAVVAAMFQSWKKAKAPAEEFWFAVRDETGPKPDAPDRKLAKWLLMSRLNTRHDTKDKATTSNRETYVKCAHAWNAWRNGEKTDLRFFSESATPKFV